jgi:ABC-2 type transport system permease protein
MGPGGFMGGMGGGMQPKGEIRKLWDALGLNVPGEPGMQGLFSPAMVWQQYNPYPNLALAPNDLWTFIDNETTFDNSAVSELNPITSGLRQVLMLYGGAVSVAEGSKLKHTPLLSTGPLSGTVALETARTAMNSPDPNALQRVEGEPTGPSTMAIAIEADATPTTGDSAETTAPASGVKAVYVADVDLMLPVFLQLRADPNQVEQVKFQFQNVTFLLNTIDWLTGENAFLEVRKHEPTFSSLRLIEEVKELANSNERTSVKKFQTDFDAAIRELEEENQRQLTALEDKIKQIRQKGTTGQVDQAELQSRLQEFQIKQGTLQQALAVKKSKFERDMNNQTQAIRRTADMEVVRIQNRVKALAVSLPCIPPLLVGIVVFTSRRLRERDNISKSRLK